MIILNGAASNGDQLLVNANSAGFANIAVHCSYVDYNAANAVVTPAANDNFISANVANQIVVANVANANNSRNIKSVVIHNTNATSPNTISVVIANGAANANMYTLYAYTLQPGETLQYFDSSGWQVLDVNGNIKVTSAVSGRLLATTVHTSGTTHTMNAGTNTARIILVGGGAGGAGTSGNATNTAYAGGGAGGAYTEIFTLVTPGATYTYAIGGGGAGGINTANAGNVGGNTTWTGNASNGTIVWTAQGGAVGATMSNAGAILPSVGGIATVANTSNSPTIAASGGAGGAGLRIANTGGGYSGFGGNSIFGAGGQPVVHIAATAGTTGTAGQAYGGGGAGAGGNGNATGGAGAAGVVIVEEFS